MSVASAISGGGGGGMHRRNAKRKEISGDRLPLTNVL